jgi:hypothetical protein
MVNARPPAGTIVIAGSLRSVMGLRVFVAVRSDSSPLLPLASATVAAMPALSVQPADAFGANAASFPCVPRGVGPAIPAAPRRSVQLGVDALRGLIDGAVSFAAPAADVPPVAAPVALATPSAVAVVRAVSADDCVLHCWRAIPPPPGGGDDPDYGGRAGELVLTEDAVDVPLEHVTGVAAIVTRQLYATMKGASGCPLYWFERKRLQDGTMLQFYPPPDAELDDVLEQWAGAGAAASPLALRHVHLARRPCARVPRCVWQTTPRRSQRRACCCVSSPSARAASRRRPASCARWFGRVATPSTSSRCRV